MTSRTRRGARSAQRHTIDALDGSEAKRLLGALLDARPDLLVDVAALASRELGAVSEERVADDVSRAIGRLRIEDVWDRPGQFSEGSHGDDSEASWAVVEDALDPFVQDLGRRIRLGRDAEALALCQGALLGLYRVDRKYGEQFLDGHAPDAVADMAGWVAQTWRKSGGRARPRRAKDRAALSAFVTKALPEWEPFLTRILGKERKRRRRA
ncbi:MAG: hypothetical protein ACREI8_03455 [Myxococcota bacterium]